MFFLTSDRQYSYDHFGRESSLLHYMRGDLNFGKAYGKTQVWKLKGGHVITHFVWKEIKIKKIIKEVDLLLLPSKYPTTLIAEDCRVLSTKTLLLSRCLLARYRRQEGYLLGKWPVNYLAIIEWGWARYEEFWRSRRVLSYPGSEICRILYILRKPNSNCFIIHSK